MLFKLTKFVASFAKDVAKEWYSQQILGNPPTPYVPGPGPLPVESPRSTPITEEFSPADRLSQAMGREAPVTKFKNAVEAMAETRSQVSQVRSEVKNRNKWAYKILDEGETVEDAKAFFKRPDAVAIEGRAVGGAHDGQRMVAVWRGLGGVEEPDTEPNF
jgi:hypothetical protein